MRIDVTEGQVQVNKQVLGMKERGQVPDKDPWPVAPEVRKMGVKGPSFKPQMEGVKRTLRVTNPLARECLGERWEHLFCW